jgi:cytoskeleton protein RodZ
MFGSTKEFERHDPDEALLREVDAQLRQARIARGEEIEDVAEFLRIRPDYLHGLEQGDIAAMPRRAYALGFLRSYAQHLGFDGDDLIAQIRSSVAGLTGQAHLHGRTPLSESRLPKLPILVVSLAALAGVYAGWAYVDDRTGAEVELVAEVPDDLRQQADPPPNVLRPPEAVRDASRPSAPRPAITPAIAPAPPSASEVAPTLPADAVTPPPTTPEEAAATAIDALEPGAGARAGATPPAAVTLEATPDAAQEALVEPAPPTPALDPAQTATDPVADVLSALAPVADGGAAPITYRTDEAASRVTLRARSSAWVHVSSTNNDYLWVKTLRPGDAFVVPDRPDLVLWTGNAGGIEVIVDGAPLPPLGPEARVARNVSLAPEDLLRRLPPAPAADATQEPPSRGR